MVNPRRGEVVGSPDPAEVGQLVVPLAAGSQLDAAGGDCFEVGEIACVLETPG